MLGTFVNTIKSRLTARVSDESFHATDESKSQGIFFKLINASYALVSQHQDDAYCNDNLFMLPRVYSHKSENIRDVWSPVSLKFPEKSLDELDNVVEKFIRCIGVENHSDDINVNRSEKWSISSALDAPFIGPYKLINDLFSFSRIYRCRGRMIEKRSDVDWRWARKTITSPTWQPHDPFASPIYSHDYKTVRINHSWRVDWHQLLMRHDLSSIFRPDAGKNLQICFMNEAASDSESSDSETCPKLSQGMNRRKNVQRPSSLMNHRTASLNNNPYNARPLSIVKSVLDQTKKGKCLKLSKWQILIE